MDVDISNVYFKIHCVKSTQVDDYPFNHWQDMEFFNFNTVTP